MCAYFIVTHMTSAICFHANFCACTALRRMYGLRRLTKHAARPRCSTESHFHGDESKPELIGALFKPLYRGNMLTQQ